MNLFSILYPLYVLINATPLLALKNDTEENTLDINQVPTTNRSLRTAKVSFTFTPAMKATLAVNINGLRRNPKVPAANMNEITYNYPLDTAINNWRYAVAKNSSIQEADRLLYAKGTGCQQPPGFKTSLWYYCLLDLPEFKQFADQGCQGVDLDSNIAGHWISVVDFRLQKAYCFDYGKCSKTEFTGYETCNNSPLTQVPGGYCANFWMYDPRWYDAHYVSIVLIATSIPPPWVTSPKQNSGYLFFACRDQQGYPPNDVPYEEGPSASNCTKGRVASNKLCKLV